MKLDRWLVGASAALACTVPLVAQDSKSEVDELMALLNTPITVASKKAMTTRESPGIVTLLRREEILASGARDLLEVLRLVPGFEFASDVQSVVSVGVRGNWGHEGKVLLLLDGQEMNEIRYATLQFGNHFPVDQIKQIEIIRGPGSAMYGGFAELAVINVITQNGEDLKGASGSLGFSRTASETSRQTISAAYGQKWGDFKFSAHYFGGSGNRSEGNSFDPDTGTYFSLRNKSHMDPRYLNLGAEWAGLSVRFIHDRYRMMDFDLNSAFFPNPFDEINFESNFLDAKYVWKLSDTFSLTPRISWKEQAPWYYTPIRDARRSVARSTVGLQASWDPMNHLSLIFGAESSKDEGTSGGESTFNNGSNSLTYNSQALYGQALWNIFSWNLTFGARFDKHEVFGSSFVPRLALTKAWSKYHIKFLASRAFRAPVIENIEFNPNIKPENTTALEMEMGAQLSSSAYASFNIFSISIKDPISYFNPEPGVDSYGNFDRTGTRGFEFDYQIRGSFGFVHSSFSYSQADGNKVPFYTVPGQDRYMVGLPNLKLTTNASFKLGNDLTFNPSIIALGTRYAYAPNTTQPHAIPPTTTINLWLNWRPKDFSVGLGVFNLMGSAYSYPQAYGNPGLGGGPAIPAAGREWVVRLGYRL